MKSMWIAVMIVAAMGCKKTEPEHRAKPDKPPASRQPLPGTESVQSLLRGVGATATKSASTQAGLGTIFGGGTGPLASGPALGDGLAGKGVSPAGTTPSTKSVDPDLDPPAASAPANVALPTPASAGGDCMAVANRLAVVVKTIAEAQLGNDADARKATEQTIEGIASAMRTQVAEACKSQSWPQNLKDCLLVASDVASLQGCERFATQSMRDAAQANASATAPRPTTPAPVWSGGTDDCAAVGRHAAAIIEWEVTAAPPDLRASSPDLIKQMQSGVESACTSAPWSAEVRRCVLGAASADALNSCSAKL